MSKTIKLDDDVYQALDEFQDKHETKSGAVGRLLEAREQIFQLLAVIEGHLSFKEWQREQLEKTADDAR